MSLLDCQRGTGKREFHYTEVLKRNLVTSTELNSSVMQLEEEGVGTRKSGYKSSCYHLPV